MRHCTAECLILGTACRFCTDEVRIGAAKTGRTYHLVSVDHDLVLGSLLDHMHIVVDEGLAVVVLSDREDVAYISALDGVVAIFVHKVEGLVEMTLVVAYR